VGSEMCIRDSPNFIRSRMRANEASAVASLRTIATSSTVYSTTYVGFEPSLASLGGTVCSNPTPAQACLLDSVLSAGLKSGYIFTYTPLYPDINNNYTAYSVTAGPLTPGTTGDRYFYVDQTAVIRQNLTTTAGPTDPPLQ